MKRIYLLILLINLPLATQAQNVKTTTLRWSLSDVFNVGTGQRDTDVPLLTTVGSTRASLQQADGSVQDYTITTTIGEWSNVQQNGEIVFSVSRDEQSGTLTLTRKNTLLSGRLILSGSTDEIIIYELTITGVIMDN